MLAPLPDITSVMDRVPSLTTFYQALNATGVLVSFRSHTSHGIAPRKSVEKPPVLSKYSVPNPTRETDPNRPMSPVGSADVKFL